MVSPNQRKPLFWSLILKESLQLMPTLRLMVHDNELKLGFYDFFCALVLVREEHHDGRTGPTLTQGIEATGIHTTTIAMKFYSPYHKCTGPLFTDIPPDAAMSLVESGKNQYL